MIDCLKQDCEKWVSSLKEVLANERDMQVSLAIYLSTSGHYDKVHVEYAVPLPMFEKHGFEVPKHEHKNWSTPENFPWHNQMYIDIVVEKDGKYAVVELKYATTYIDKKPTIFAEEVPNGIETVKKQGAQDIVMYNYWKDVRRIEAVSRFPNAVGGVALIISNDKAYWSVPRALSGYLPFSPCEGNTVGPGRLVWNDSIGDTAKEAYPPFRLDGSYPCHWENTHIPVRARTKGLEPFRYMMTVIYKT